MEIAMSQSYRMKTQVPAPGAVLLRLNAAP